MMFIFTMVSSINIDKGGGEGRSAVPVVFYYRYGCLNNRFRFPADISFSVEPADKWPVGGLGS